ncbi:MAG: TlpA family protein disulfide reductase [Rhodospirillum sp.]|nr:TlpA family protein disulfide reductase [Rhodospirillum sp.]MCF8489544.1 TlpA family protein disulfide reductase [Rhodospirillum sp.]MCF8499733.1 TlpA family protein disulfide reductase [Rhodospirillum sp.]
MMGKPLFRNWARRGSRAGLLALGGLILTISAQDARAQTADTLCALGKRAALAETVADAPLSVTPPGERGAPVDLPYRDGAGRELRLSDLRGQVVVLNVWATWCAPCVREMPTLESLAEKTAGRGVTVLPLSQDRGGDTKVPAFYEGAGITHLPIALDPTLTAGKVLGLRGLPTTLILDKDGREVARHEGFKEWDGPDVLSVLGALVAESTQEETGLPKVTETSLAAR